MKVLVVLVACVVGTVFAKYHTRVYPTSVSDQTETCLSFKTCTRQARWSLPYPVCGEGSCTKRGDGSLVETITYCPFPELNEQCTWVNANETSFGAFPDCCPRFKCPAGVTLVYPPEDDAQLVGSVDAVRADAQKYFCHNFFNLPKPTPPEDVPPPPPLTDPKEPAPARPTLVEYV